MLFMFEYLFNRITLDIRYGHSDHFLILPCDPDKKKCIKIESGVDLLRVEFKIINTELNYIFSRH